MIDDITTQETRGFELRKPEEIVVNIKPVDTSKYILEVDSSVPFIAVVWMEAGKLVSKSVKYSKVLLALISLFTSITKGAIMDSKHWYLSKTIIGGIIMFLVTILQTAHVIPADAVNSQELTDKLVGIIGYVVEFISFVLVIVGRVTARKTIGK